MDWAICEGVPLHPGPLPRGLSGLHCKILLPLSLQHAGALLQLHGSCMHLPRLAPERPSECMRTQIMLQVANTFLMFLDDRSSKLPQDAC